MSRLIFNNDIGTSVQVSTNRFKPTLENHFFQYVAAGNPSIPYNRNATPSNCMHFANVGFPSSFHITSGNYNLAAIHEKVTGAILLVLEDDQSALTSKINTFMTEAKKCQRPLPPTIAGMDNLNTISPFVSGTNARLLDVIVQVFNPLNIMVGNPTFNTGTSSRLDSFSIPKFADQNWMSGSLDLLTKMQQMGNFTVTGFARNAYLSTGGMSTILGTVNDTFDLMVLFEPLSFTADAGRIKIESRESAFQPADRLRWNNIRSGTAKSFVLLLPEILQGIKSTFTQNPTKAVKRVGSNNALYPTNFPMLSFVGSVSDLAGNGDLKFETTDFLENDYLFFPNINFNAANALSLKS